MVLIVDTVPDDAADTGPPSRAAGSGAAAASATPGFEARLAELMGVLNTVTAELVGVLGQVLDREAWAGLGYRSPEHWVQVQCGVAPGRAARWLEVARRLGTLPRCTALFRAGGLTEDQAALVYRHTPARLDAWSAQVAPWLTVGQMRRVLHWMPKDDQPGGTNNITPPADDTNDPEPDSVARGAADAESARDAPTAADIGSGADDPGAAQSAGSAPDREPAEPQREPGPVRPRPLRLQPERREVRFGYDDDGNWWCRLQLPADEGALVQRAFEAARNRLFQDRHPDDDNDAGTGPAPGGADPTITWADALVLLAQLGLDGLDPDTPSGRAPGERYQVLLHLDADGDNPPALHLGPVLPGWAAEYRACDSTVRCLLFADGEPIGKRRRTRTVDAPLRAIVEHRDGGCRVPGCGATRWLHVHHIQFWGKGGETEVTNLCCLCPVHHRMVHRGELTITGDPTRPDGLVFTNRHGTAIRPPGPRPPDRPGLAGARTLDLPTPIWHPPTGEPLDTWAISWN